MLDWADSIKEYRNYYRLTTKDMHKSRHAIVSKPNHKMSKSNLMRNTGYLQEVKNHGYFIPHIKDKVVRIDKFPQGFLLQKKLWVDKDKIIPIYKKKIHNNKNNELTNTNHNNKIKSK